MRRKSTYAKMIHVVQFSEQKNWKIEINSLKNGLQNVKLESQNLGKGILFLASQNGAKKDHIANVITYDEYQFINYCFRSFMCALNTIEILFHMLLCNKMRKKRFQLCSGIIHCNESWHRHSPAIYEWIRCMRLYTYEHIPNIYNENSQRKQSKQS